MPPGADPPVVAQCASPRVSIATSRISMIRSAAAREHASGSTSVTIVGSSMEGASGQLSRELEDPHRDRVATPGLDRLREEVDVGPPWRIEATLEGVDAVLPDPDMDRVLLRGDVGPKLGAAPVGEELDADGRAGRKLGHHRADDHRDIGSLDAQRRPEPCAGGRELRRSPDAGGPASRAGHGHRLEGPYDVHPEARPEPGRVIEGL